MPTLEEAGTLHAVAGFHPEVAAVHEAVGPHGEPLTPEQKVDIAANKDVAAMSYLWLLSVVIYYQRRDSLFIRYHSKQGLWLFALSIPVFLIPGVGHFLSFFTLAGMIIGFLNAAQGHYHDVPIIGKLARGTLTLGDIARRAFHHGRRAADAVKRGVVPTAHAPATSPTPAAPAVPGPSGVPARLTLSLAPTTSGPPPSGTSSPATAPPVHGPGFS